MLGTDPSDFTVVERILVVTGQRLLVVAPLDKEILLEDEPGDGASPTSAPDDTQLVIKSNHHLTEIGKLRISAAEPSVITIM